MNRRLTTWTAALALAVAGVARTGTGHRAQARRLAACRAASRRGIATPTRSTSALSLGDQRIIPVGEAAVLECRRQRRQPAGERARGRPRRRPRAGAAQLAKCIRGRLTNIEGGDGSGRRANRARWPSSPTTPVSAGCAFRRCAGSTSGTIRRRRPRRQRRAGQPSPRCRPGRCACPATARWVTTNVTLRRTDRVQFTTEGQVQLSSDADDRPARPARCAAATPPTRRRPSLLAGALIGRIGNGAPFAIGDQTQALPMPGRRPALPRRQRRRGERQPGRVRRHAARDPRPALRRAAMRHRRGGGRHRT